MEKCNEGFTSVLQIDISVRQDKSACAGAPYVVEVSLQLTVESVWGIKRRSKHVCRVPVSQEVISYWSGCGGLTFAMVLTMRMTLYRSSTCGEDFLIQQRTACSMERGEGQA